MNNEEKILHAVETLAIMQTAAQAEIAAVKSDISELKTGQTRLLESIRKIEYEHGRKLDEIVDRLDVIEERLDSAEINIRVFDKRLRKA